MSDRLREALEGVPMDPSERYRIVWAAARRFLALTETGQRVEWCETHELPASEGGTCDPYLPACRVVPKLLILADYLTEEE